jgi:hypothetical protein
MAHLARQNAEESVDEAVAVIQRDYYKEVNQYADDFIERIKEGEWDNRDDFIDSFNQEIDGAARVIYTWQAQLGLLVSENDDAGIESLGPDGFDWSSGIPWSALMYFAFEADIYEAMDRKDFDVNDDELFEPDDE